MAAGGGSGARVAGRQQQVHPVDYSSEISQRLVNATHQGDIAAAMECLANPMVNVNFAGAVRFKGRRTELVPRDQTASFVRFDCEEFLTDLSPLFLAAHSGDLPLLRKLLSLGADVNQKLFRGYATAAAVREGRENVVELLVNAGAGQDACEEAVVEASRHGMAPLVELLMASELIRSRVAIHALVTAASHGFVQVVDAFLKIGVDGNGTDRMLLQSLKPSLHTNSDCTPLVAAVVNRQVAVVRRLLEAGVRPDVPVRLGAWSWDAADATGEEYRVGAGLAEPYDAVFCAVEYFESTGEILRLLLRRRSPDFLHLGRSLLHHAILCNCPFAVNVLIASGCDLNAKTASGETALTLSGRYQHAACVKILVSAGADFGLVPSAAQWSEVLRDTLIEAIRSGVVPRSSDSSVFSPMRFVAKCGDELALKALLLNRPETVNIDEQDEKGFSAAMVAAWEGHVEAFRLLVFAGAHVEMKNKAGETAVEIYHRWNKKVDLFEQVMLEYALEKQGGIMDEGVFYEALHRSAQRGDIATVRRLLGSSKEYDVNVPDGEGYTPLMVAAREGHGAMCELLIKSGARCDVQTPRGETALSLARWGKGGLKNKAEEVIMDEVARRLVVEGGRVKKHTKEGKWWAHGKNLRMVEERGVLRWGRSRTRNVVCKAAERGGSAAFQRNRRRKGEGLERGLFRVVTRKGKEVHFVCKGGDEEAELWVRGIMIVTGLVYGDVS